MFKILPTYTFLLCVLLSSCVPSAKASVLEVNPARVIQLNEVVGPSIRDRLIEMLTMAVQSKEPISILINSPGGYVSFGEEFMQAMNRVKESGVLLQCVAGETVASMAMIIFDNCSTRYALPKANLLWHPVKVVMREPISSRVAKEIAEELKRIDDYYRFPMIEHLGVDEASFEEARWAEKWWTTPELIKYSPNYMQAIDEVVGVEVLALNPAVPVVISGTDFVYVLGTL